MRRTIPILLLLAAILLTSAPAVAQPSSADAEVAFTYGVRAFNRGEWDEAVRLFREAAAAAPDDENVRAWLELALAKQRGGTVSAPGFDGLVALRDQPRFDFRVGAAYGEDSNPGLQSDDNPFGGLGEEDDRVTDFDLRAAVYPLYSRSADTGRASAALGVSAQLKGARFEDLDFLNQRQWSAAVHLALGSDPLGYLTGPLGYTRVPFGHSRFSLLLQAGRTETRVDGEPLLTADEMALSLVCRETVKTATQIDLDFQKQDYVDGLRKPEVWSASGSQLFFFGRRDRYLRIGVTRGEVADGFFEDATFLVGTAELALPLSDRLSLQLAASRRKDERELSQPFGLPTFNFDTTTSRATAALSWRMVRGLHLVGRTAWSESDFPGPLIVTSPLISFSEYERTSVSLGIQWIW